LFKLDQIVEKPKPEDAPSNLAVVGRYVLHGSIMQLLETQTPGTGGEIQLTDAIAKLVSTGDVFGYRFDGRRFDCGSKKGFLEANIHFGFTET
jgi:UTP--glucose-1-phosphate uridylyltransferase